MADSATADPVATAARAVTDESRTWMAVASEETLLRRFASAPESALEAELVARYMPFAQWMNRRYRNGFESNDDLAQVANLALIKALRGFDPDRGKRFTAFAAPTILGELKRHFRDRSWRLHMPRGLQERMLLVERTTVQLTAELATAPTNLQIAERLGLSEEEVLDTVLALESQWPGSLDVPVGEEDATTVGDTIGRDEAGFDAVEAQFAIECCAELTGREREVVGLRFIDGLAQTEIGTRVGVSQMQVSRDLRRALGKLLEAVRGAEAPSRRQQLPRGRATSAVI